jgi:hypothetical protein
VVALNQDSHPNKNAMVRVSSIGTLHDIAGRARSDPHRLAWTADPGRRVKLIAWGQIAHWVTNEVGVGRSLWRKPERPTRFCRAPFRKILVFMVVLFFGEVHSTPADPISQSGAAFARYAMKLRRDALYRICPTVITSPSSLATDSSGSESLADRAEILSRRFSWHPWKLEILSTVFWIGERPSAHNPVPNDRSSWDSHWFANYGGYDNPRPGARRNFVPIGFTPRQNPFYVALPYNDVDKGHTKPEASRVIPWFRTTFQRNGQSVLKGRWLAIRKGEKICYAQWEDCGPFRTDDWQYVFGNERPKPNLNGGAGLDVSPAVRDYLGLRDKDVCDWRFVESTQVPDGPWAVYVTRNTLVSIQVRDRGPFNE